MTMKARLTLVAMVVLAAMWSTGCGHYVCGITKGASTCSSGGGVTKSGGGGAATGDAYVYTANPGAIQSLTLTEAQDTLAVSCFPATSPICPQGLPNVAVGTEEWAVIAQKNVLYVGYSPSSVYAWTIASDGSLTNGPSTVYPFTLPFAVAGVGQQAMITNPAGTLLFFIDSQNAQIDVYQIGSSGGLTAVGVPVALPSGFQPYNLAMDGLGKYLYVSNVSGVNTSQIVAYSVSNGVLSTVPGSPFSLNLIQMQGDPSGQFMIGTKSTLSNADPNIYVLGITQSGANAGAITSLGQAPTANPPNNVAVQTGANGTLVYGFSLIGTSVGGPVEGYTLTPSTGALTIMSGSPFLNVGGDSGQFDQSGKFLFVRDLFSKNMTAFDVTTSPTLSTSVGSQGWAQDPWAWAVTDPN